MSAWWLLGTAGVVEIAMELALKPSDDLRKPLPTQAIRHLPAGTAYAAWTGIGGMIVAGIAGLRLLET